MCHLSTEFCENLFSSFCAVLMINKQTDELTKADENITSSAEGIKSNIFLSKKMQNNTI